MSAVYVDVNEMELLKVDVEDVSCVTSKININRFHHTMNSTLPLQAAAAKLFHNNIVNRIELIV